jgi:hypothetical protein
MKVERNTKTVVEYVLDVDGRIIKTVTTTKSTEEEV